MSMIRSAVSDEFISTSLDVPRCFLLQVPQLRGDLIDWLTPLGSKAVGRPPHLMRAPRCAAASSGSRVAEHDRHNTYDSSKV